MAQLLDSIKSHLKPSLIQQTAALLGEKETAVAQALSGMVPVILTGILHKSNDPQGNVFIYNVLSDSRNITFTHDPASLINNGNLAHDDPKDIAGDLMGKLFGHNVPAIINALAAFSGVKAASASSLLGMAGPIVMGVLSQKIRDEQLSPEGLAHALNACNGAIIGALPGGLSAVMRLPQGLGKVARFDDPQPSSGSRWLLPLVLLILLGGAIILYMKACAQ